MLRWKYSSSRHLSSLELILNCIYQNLLLSFVKSFISVLQIFLYAPWKNVLIGHIYIWKDSWIWIMKGPSQIIAQQMTSRPWKIIPVSIVRRFLTTMSSFFSATRPISRKSWLAWWARCCHRSRGQPSHARCAKIWRSSRISEVYPDTSAASISWSMICLLMKESTRGYRHRRSLICILTKIKKFSSSGGYSFCWKNQPIKCKCVVLNIRSFTIKESEENKFFSPTVFILSIESIYNLHISASLISL